MRPKIVVLTLMVAFGLLGVIAVMKGVAEKHEQVANPGAPVTSNVPGTQAKGDTDPAGTNPPATTFNSHAGNPPAASEEVRQAVIQTELDRIRELCDEADGTNNPTIIAALLDKLDNPEAEVRKGVLDALMQLNDTNAVPGLQKAAQSMKDARDKVEVLNAIDYINLPSPLGNVPADQATNNAPVRTVVRSPNTNPKFLRDFNATRRQETMARLRNLLTRRQRRPSERHFDSGVASLGARPAGYRHDGRGLSGLGGNS